VRRLPAGVTRTGVRLGMSLVMKFGGAALADAAGVRRACALVAARAAERPLVVVSAHRGVTDLLEVAARDAARGQVQLDALRIRHRSILARLGLDPELIDRLLAELSAVLARVRSKGRVQAGELDFVLSFGERMSARVVAAALRREGLAATPVDAFDLGLTTDSAHGHARPLPGVPAALRASLGGVPGVPVVTGFLAKDPLGNLTTLGRNGSDLTAALVAEAVGAAELVLWKTVPGVMSADPRDVPEARVIERLSIEEAQALAAHGAEVLHPEALAPLARAGARLRVLDVAHPGRPGTLVEGARGEARAPGTLAALGLACERELGGIALAGGGGSRAALELLALCCAQRLEPRFLVAGGGAFAVHFAAGEDLDALERGLGARAERLPPVAAVTVVGSGGPALGARALEILRAESVDVRRAFLAGSPAQTFLVVPDDRVRALRALHAGLLERVLA